MYKMARILGIVVQIGANLAVLRTECPNKSVTFFTKHETITFCSIAKILFNSEGLCIDLNFDTLASPICEIFFEIRKSKDRNVFSNSRF